MFYFFSIFSVLSTSYLKKLTISVLNTELCTFCLGKRKKNGKIFHKMKHNKFHLKMKIENERI